MNAKAEALWGRPRETLIGRNMWSEFPMAVGGKPHAQHLGAMRDRQPAYFEGFSPVLSRWMEAILYPDPVSGGLACYFRDATERRAAEAALRESEARFKQFAEASSAGLWIRTAATLDREYVSPAIMTIYGIAASALQGDMTRWASMILPEDRDIALGNIEAVRQGRSVVHEFRIQRPADGVVHWIKNTDFPLSSSTSASRSACVTSRTLWQSGASWCPTRRSGAAPKSSGGSSPDTCAPRGQRRPGHGISTR